MAESNESSFRIGCGIVKDDWCFKCEWNSRLIKVAESSFRIGCSIVKDDWCLRMEFEVY